MLFAALFMLSNICACSASTLLLLISALSWSESDASCKDCLWSCRSESCCSADTRHPVQRKAISLLSNINNAVIQFAFILYYYFSHDAWLKFAHKIKSFYKIQYMASLSTEQITVRPLRLWTDKENRRWKVK